MAKRVSDRKEQIVVEATSLFSSRGFDKVSIKELAAACGISEPALYRHFKSKEDIYNAVLDSVEARLNYEDLFEKLQTEDDVEKLLMALSTHIIEFFTDNADLYRLLLYSALRGHHRAKQIFRLVRGTYVRFLMQQLDRLYAKKLIVKKNNEITSRCFIGMVFDCALGTTLWRGFQGKLFAPLEIVKNNIPIYARGLRK